MSRWTRYLERASHVIGTYQGDTPLAPVLKDYFRGERQMGSTDRRIVSDLVYSFYRLGWAVRELPLEERLLLAYWLTRTASSPLLAALRPEWDALVGLTPSEKVAVFDARAAPGPAFPDGIFPWKDALSRGVDPPALALSHLQQPDFYIRVRPGRLDDVMAALKRNGIPFEVIDGPAGAPALRLPAGASLQDLLPPDVDYVVQDLSSQRVGTLLSPVLAAPGGAPRVWDCCAASGGKSIMVKDLYPRARLTVSDIRPSILHNLDRRFAAAGIRYEQALVADLSKPGADPGVFDLVLADVPCTGSGTWSRTPEQLYFFDPEKICEFARLQRAILRRVAPAVVPGGYLLLITCSVFAEENEGNVAFLLQEGLELCQQEVFKGYGQGADTLFGALLRKPARV
ncbi:RsmB/NOP family class I SAM-dependent RNA methyltransferase [Dinghuibacter silviterrae]|uniref:16S rRNA (Cytosine967-C5)-methyltransferase n=1 Tax=Dinghuibacter silviterrae TaxID=1539049 RepID=A0A4R8DT50_9BACT|nr:Fmu (Sun) domain protein [Dinghuibacter silviterrae]TDX00587.1 16S rRNA (cytosine967-C5)-methyltransferase [Dinghuibacter silviterrae]